MIGINQELSHVLYLKILDNLMTYGIMAVSAVGYIIAKRGGYSTLSLGAAFFASPVFALYHKR